jgi:hypothetical protein
MVLFLLTCVIAQKPEVLAWRGVIPQACDKVAHAVGVAGCCVGIPLVVVRSSVMHRGACIVKFVDAAELQVLPFPVVVLTWFKREWQCVYKVFLRLSL